MFTSSKKPKVLVSRGDVLQEALDILTKAGCELVVWSEPSNIPRAELLRLAPTVDAIFCVSPPGVRVDEELLQAAGPNLKVIGTCSAGYDHVDVEAAKRHNVRIGNTPDVLTDAVADLSIAILLATSRRLFEGNRALLDGKCSWTPTWMCGWGIKNSTVGLFGFGRIAQAIVTRLAPFRVRKFIYNSRNPHPEVNTAEFVSFDRLLAESDFLIVIAACNDQTRGIFNAKAFEKMKKTAIFVNTSRGEIVNQPDLVQALKSGQIRAAGLDVMTPEPLPPGHELTQLDNCVLIPHLGSAEVDTRMEMVTMTSRNILLALQGKEMEATVC